MLFVLLLRNFHVIGAGSLDPNGWLIGPRSQLCENVYQDRMDEDYHSNSLLKYIALISLKALAIWGM